MLTTRPDTDCMLSAFAAWAEAAIVGRAAPSPADKAITDNSRTEILAYLTMITPPS
jgi:hypothetical protein